MEGDAIWLNSRGGWTRHLHAAHLFNSKSDAEAALEKADRERHIHVGAYLAAALPGVNRQPEPQHVRERMRTEGPSNYFHGKQADAQNVSI